MLLTAFLVLTSTSSALYFPTLYIPDANIYVDRVWWINESEPYLYDFEGYLRFNASACNGSNITNNYNTYNTIYNITNITNNVNSSDEYLYVISEEINFNDTKLNLTIDDKLSSIDFSNYYTKDNVYNKSEVYNKTESDDRYWNEDGDAGLSGDFFGSYDLFTTGNVFIGMSSSVLNERLEVNGRVLILSGGESGDGFLLGMLGSNLQFTKLSSGIYSGTPLTVENNGINVTGEVYAVASPGHAIYGITDGSSTSAIKGVATGAGSEGVYGEGFYGVYGISEDTSGAGLYGKGFVNASGSTVVSIGVVGHSESVGSSGSSYNIGVKGIAKGSSLTNDRCYGGYFSADSECDQAKYSGYFGEGNVLVSDDLIGLSCPYAKTATFWSERGAITSNAPLAMGNGQTPTGAPQVCSGRVVALAAMCSGAADASNHVAFELRVNGVSQNCDTAEVTSLNTMYQASTCDVAFNSGDLLNCYSKTETGTVTECVCVWWVQYD